MAFTSVNFCGCCCCCLGLLAEDELDTRAMDAIKDLSVVDALAVLCEFQANDLVNIANKSALICTLIKARRLKARGGKQRDEWASGDAGKSATLPGPDPVKFKVENILNVFRLRNFERV